MTTSRITNKKKGLRNKASIVDDYVGNDEDEEESFEEKLPTVDEWKDVSLKRKRLKRKRG